MVLNLILDGNYILTGSSKPSAGNAMLIEIMTKHRRFSTLMVNQAIMRGKGTFHQSQEPHQLDGRILNQPFKIDIFRTRNCNCITFQAQLL